MMNSPLISILVVSLNPGEKLMETMRSIEEQTFTDYEVILKDGGSRDGALDVLRRYLPGRALAERVRIIEQPDIGIYDAMNQAAGSARGEYYYFLNCGDVFASRQALEQAAREITSRTEEEPSLIFYGDIYDALRGQTVPSNPYLDDFACYRNVPCHQACIYHRSLFGERGYNPVYRVRADYEHFLWCYFRGNARPQYMPVTLASYEGGGFSETPENRRRAVREHREITALYMGKGQLLRYRLILLITLAPLRTRMSESPVWSGLYNRAKKLLYRRGRTSGAAR